MIPDQRPFVAEIQSYRAERRLWCSSIWSRAALSTMALRALAIPRRKRLHDWRNIPVRHNLVARILHLSLLGKLVDVHYVELIARHKIVEKVVEAFLGCQMYRGLPAAV